MKRVLACLLTVMLFLTCVPAALAADNSRDFFFQLSVDGSDKKEVQPGDIIQVDFNLNRTDSADAYTMYGMQNEIRYDSNFFQLVEGSALLSNGISTTDIGLRDNYRDKETDQNRPKKHPHKDRIIYKVTFSGKTPQICYYASCHSSQKENPK